MPRPIRIGTRHSPLALVQANTVAARLRQALGLDDEEVEIRPMGTTGDRIRDRPLAALGGKGLFTKEIEDALEADEIDIAVHSMKDMPTELPAGLVIDAMLEREDPRDAFLSAEYASLDALPEGAKLGTSSLRRAAQARHLRPDIEIIPFRGNVHTRLNKLSEGEADATLLAMAGLKRLGLEDRAAQALPEEDFLPAIAQGAIGIERREADGAMQEALASISHAPTLTAVGAERAFLAALDGSCQTPIAGYAALTEGAISLKGAIFRPDGSEMIAGSREGAAADGAALGADLGAELRAKAGPGFFDGA